MKNGLVIKYYTFVQPDESPKNTFPENTETRIVREHIRTIDFDLENGDEFIEIGEIKMHTGHPRGQSIRTIYGTGTL